MDSIFCERLLALMRQYGISDKTLERELHLPKDSVYNWTHGVTKSYHKYISILAKRFKVTTDYLLGNDKIHTNDKAESQLLEIFKQLDEEGKRLAIGMLKTLLTEHSQKNSAASVNEVTA